MDMAATFLQALAADGFIDTEKISNKSLDEIYGPNLIECEESLKRQENLLAKIQEANSRFLAETQTPGAVNEREEMLKQLAQAYDAYIELISNLKEGTKFYNDLTNILLKFQSKFSDLAFARRTEKDDLSKDIQNDLAKSTPAPTPAVPAHIEAQQRVPPARPAPPQMAPASTSATAPAYPTQSYMPQPGVYAPPGGISGYAPGGYMQPQGYQPGYYQPAPQGYNQPAPQGYIPPQNNQQQQVGYTGYPYQRPPQQ